MSNLSTVSNKTSMVMKRKKKLHWPLSIDPRIINSNDSEMKKCKKDYEIIKRR